MYTGLSNTPTCASPQPVILIQEFFCFIHHIGGSFQPSQKFCYQKKNQKPKLKPNTIAVIFKISWMLRNSTKTNEKQLLSGARGNKE